MLLLPLQRYCINGQNANWKRKKETKRGRPPTIFLHIATVFFRLFFVCCGRGRRNSHSPIRIKKSELASIMPAGSDCFVYQGGGVWDCFLCPSGLVHLSLINSKRFLLREPCSTLPPLRSRNPLCPVAGGCPLDCVCPYWPPRFVRFPILSLYAVSLQWQKEHAGAPFFMP